MTTTSPHDVYRFLEDRFACAQSCTECARTCALRAGLAEPDEGPGAEELPRRSAIMCAEVCDATRRVLAQGGEQGGWDEAAIRGQVEWCRAVCLEGAHLLDTDPDGAQAAHACRVCARACADFLGTLS
ncbi:ferredoxin [Streptomyces sp. NPDC048664]|uniref:ferredoxin n=1 Tax=Streptomyces sp. NPDC048664 TaxID=3154505 RepID=UPI0034386B0E